MKKPNKMSVILIQKQLIKNRINYNYSRISGEFRLNMSFVRVAPNRAKQSASLSPYTYYVTLKKKKTCVLQQLRFQHRFSQRLAIFNTDLLGIEVFAIRLNSKD